jgi:hypothetical protein
LFLSGSGCGGSTEEPNPGPGLHVIGTREITDTVLTILKDPMTVELRNAAGQPQAGVSIVFEGHGANGLDTIAYLKNPGVSTTPSNYRSFNATATVVTDANGRAAVSVALGSKAGNASVVARALTDGSIDSLTLVVRPGRATGLVLLPSDTSLLLGRSFTFQARQTDKWNNAIDTPLTGLSLSLDSGSSITPGTSGTVSSTALGRALITLRALGTVAQARISVVPVGTLAMYASGGGSSGVYVAQTDGSDGHWLYKAPAPGPFSGPRGIWPTWSPDGSSVAFTHDRILAVVPASNGAFRDLPTPALAIAEDVAPRFSADGRWIYFSSGGVSAPRLSWRIHPDGTGLDSVVDPAGLSGISAPRPSPDGSRLLVHAGSAQSNGLFFLPTNGGPLQDLHIPVAQGEWSPLGDRIAFIAPVQSGFPDAGIRYLTAAGQPLQDLHASPFPPTDLSWSSDGQWLVGSLASYYAETSYDLPMFPRRVEFVNVHTGLTIPAFIKGPPDLEFRQPSWKPVR